MSALSVASMLEASYERFATRVALIEPGSVSRTYRELGERANRFANALKDRGVSKGDRVAIVAANSASYIEVSHGIFIGGFVRVALSNKLHEDEINGILEDCEASVLVVGEDEVERLRDIPRSKSMQLISLGATDGPVTGFEDLLVDAGSTRSGDVPSSTDLCALLYTSGTTGKPKGVTLTHANWVAMIRNSMSELPTIGVDDVILHVAPLSHFSGYVEPTCSVRGATHLVHSSFDPVSALEAIEGERVTIVPLVPTMLNMMLPEIGEGRDFSSLRTVLYGGSGIAPDRLAQAVNAFGDVFVQFFGLSETPMPLSALSQRDHEFDPAGPHPARLGSAGRPNPFVELKLRADDGSEAPLGEVGEILVRGDNVMLGYWGNPEQTAETVDEQGWAHTGDVGRFDEDGYLYIVDRKRDMIISGGYNIYPAEVENAILTLDGIHEVAVVGVPDQRWGEAVKAVAVVRADHEVSEGDVVEACAGRLAPYKKPRSVDFVEELPKTGSGKIMRRKIRDRYWDTEARSVGG